MTGVFTGPVTCHAMTGPVTGQSPRRSFSEESRDTLPRVLASILASTRTSADPTTTG
ncbi:hypothetical protein DPMN_026098 [Dreissena polymorpha]|uniref:Uncharacterized protein n=1 Tax=Dreissena polymorpha TaxID=45954 RepID=A0A9D4LQH8_DREPO|nr:hypothetical protein DPMN_026098 [Dreissena polymorpha]